MLSLEHTYYLYALCRSKQSKKLFKDLRLLTPQNNCENKACTIGTTLMNGLICVP